MDNRTPVKEESMSIVRNSLAAFFVTLALFAPVLILGPVGSGDAAPGQQTRPHLTWDGECTVTLQSSGQDLHWRFYPHLASDAGDGEFGVLAGGDRTTFNLTDGLPFWIAADPNLDVVTHRPRKAEFGPIEDVADCPPPPTTSTSTTQPPPPPGIELDTEAACDGVTVTNVGDGPVTVDIQVGDGLDTFDIAAGETREIVGSVQPGWGWGVWTETGDLIAGGVVPECDEDGVPVTTTTQPPDDGDESTTTTTEPPEGDEPEPEPKPDSTLPPDVTVPPEGCPDGYHDGGGVCFPDVESG